MFALFLTAFLACSSETKETTIKENKTNTTEKTKPIGPMTTTSNTSGASDTTTTKPTTGQTVDSQKTDVKEYVEKAVNTSEAEQMFLLAFLFACTEDHFRIDSGILTIEACISIAPEGDCIRNKKQKVANPRADHK